MNPLFAANLGLVITVLVWGTPIPLFDLLLERWDPVGLAALRYFCAIPLLFVVLWIAEPRLRWRFRLRPDGVGWPRLLLIGGLGVGGFAIFFLVGLRYSDPVTVAVLAAASPIIAALTAWLCYRQRPPSGIALALILAVGGGLLVRADFSADGGAIGFEGGEPLILLAIACWSWYSVTAQHAMPHCSQIQLTAATAIPAGVLLLATYGLLLAMGLVGAPPAAPSAGDLLLIIWLSVSTVVIGVLAWNIGVKRLGVVVASMFLDLIPVAGVLTAAALGSPPTLEQVLGGLLIIAGVLQAQLRGLARARAARRRDGTPGA